MMDKTEIEHKVLSWKVKKVGNENYQVVRPHKFILVIDEADLEHFNYRVLAEERAMRLNSEEKRKEQK
jgi:hypothetical protein